MDRRKIALIFVAPAALLCVFLTAWIYVWNIRTTALIYSEFAKLVGNRNYCILIGADKRLKPRSGSPHDKIDSIYELTAISILQRRMRRPNPTGSAGYWLAVIVAGEVYNWSFNEKKFVQPPHHKRFLFGYPQNSDDPACIWR
ncbi:hypothetical protein LH464_24080 [Neorhizobium sp. T786]|uniref:hypothetical protein n=1 Tax=Pseudorhizobium xiangyangii TaxID=2883104 RepID=UPI001CFFB202|nr:hypothetical protein [Neorhizobium xiangyangii]MCB5205521.1 hypothetical protein [Neorhizobium xiangyangii]